MSPSTSHHEGNKLIEKAVYRFGLDQTPNQQTGVTVSKTVVGQPDTSPPSMFHEVHKLMWKTIAVPRCSRRRQSNKRVHVQMLCTKFGPVLHRHPNNRTVQIQKCHSPHLITKIIRLSRKLYRLGLDQTPNQQTGVTVSKTVVGQPDTSPPSMFHEVHKLMWKTIVVPRWSSRRRKGSNSERSSSVYREVR